MSNVIRLVRVGSGVRRVEGADPAGAGAMGAGLVGAGDGARVGAAIGAAAWAVGGAAGGAAASGRDAPSSPGEARGDGAAGARPRIRAVPGGIAPLVGARIGAEVARGGIGAARAGIGAVRALPARAMAAPRPAGLAEGEVIDAAWVVARLEEAGRTLLALPGSGYSTRLRTSNLDIVRTAMEAYGGGTARVRPPVPSAAHITRMDEALGWIPLIPQDRYVLRRIVGARCLVSPVTDRALYSWRKLGDLMGADHKAVQRWHAQGIAMLVSLLGG